MLLQSNSIFIEEFELTILYLSSFLDFGGKCGREQGRSVLHLELNLELFSILECLLDRLVCFCTTFF
jgi:hypothetical protein